ncbi:tripartite tricarboxylate transporter substrate binding protein [Staphylococcus pseudintermedius]|uniref:tripartite tricarboxylate transporter substrate binding protein n=1 Tax=Staphylococcus pseudintermedius TaxID=283734 RepID=UPI00089DC2D4|nr:tripartite tricarboxylate transporter substrate binding protein [Staphylococcus pseudintermedius]EGQ0327692.1 tripartite tricarboxylate transporter substrate binding protein [Staphylococcus pseudintermedius]EGQ3261024.1 tripartite tricarboxylate transporter substrate binding protein [Staphylococcus pseudintermedius]EJA1949615.1 tripartite tricarboxylate transporter substrate binding protein [Staphylococcus pseudintermedius]EKF8407579.1 tripartite tricarboxylate transporter substrate binding 
MRKLVTCFMGLVLILAACTNNDKDDKPQTSSSQKFPNRTVEIIAPASPGGGWDATARAIQKIMQDEKLTDQNITVVNKPGGGGEVGWQYLSERQPTSIAINSSLLLSNHELDLSDLRHQDFTPIAILATEWISLSASNQSHLSSGKEVMKKLKADPKSLTIGVAPGLGNNDHLAFVQAAKAYGVDVKHLDFLVYKSGGDLETALLGGHVDIASTAVSEVKTQHQAGKLKVLATTSDQRVKGLEDVPTWKEQGLNMVFPHWRGVMGPKNMTKEERAYWNDTMKKVVHSKQWETIRKNKNWDAFYKDSYESEKFLNEQQKKYKQLIQDAGF